MDEWVIWGGLVVFLGGMAAFFVFMRMRYVEKGLDAYLTGPFGAKEVEGAYYPFQRSRNGLTFGLDHGGSDKEGWLTMGVAMSSPFPLELTVQNRTGLGLLDDLIPDLAIGDAGFDQEVFVVSSNDEFTRMCLTDARARAAVRGLFNLGCTNIFLHQDRLEAKWDSVNSTRMPDWDPVRQAADLLETLARTLPATLEPVFKTSSTFATS